MRIVLPYPPSANRYWRVWRGRAVISKEARKYKNDAALLARSQRGERIDGDVVLHIYAYRPRKRGDLDNVIKIALDALNGIAYGDDAQIVGIIAWRFDDKDNPRLVVDVSEDTRESVTT